MRLLLSSWYLKPDDRPAVLPPPTSTGRAGIVLNALDQYGHSRDRDLPREVHTWETFGYTCEELDLRDHFSAPEDLRNRVADFDLVRALGGNAFVLARAMTRSRFADAVKERLNRPSSSTAAVRPVPVFTGPDLRGIDLIDDPAVRPDGYPSGIEPDCLGLVPFRVVPHWRSDHPDAAGADQAAGHLTEAGLQQRCLRDGQTISVQEVSDLAA
ncbi:Type 1 glutamine amidotransferase-like domain-containing protein [Streptomyces sp. NBC_00316]|uniref:Type 1 glutamine amidotransferase-like domain-containing protein n=1 Tax=Streptomyces sp. NBC_00316 TaxID=2975710 RepID=UPI002E2D1367|nr:Type 1 glutamine amidotransferase-like domain-containing protein [Streptomyces sp. NBC_00316]